MKVFNSAIICELLETEIKMFKYTLIDQSSLKYFLLKTKNE